MSRIGNLIKQDLNQSTCKVGLAGKKLLLKHKNPLNMSKIEAGFCIQDNVKKIFFCLNQLNCIEGGQEQYDESIYTEM